MLFNVIAILAVVIAGNAVIVVVIAVFDVVVNVFKLGAIQDATHGSFFANLALLIIDEVGDRRAPIYIYIYIYYIYMYGQGSEPSMRQALTLWSATQVTTVAHLENKLWQKYTHGERSDPCCSRPQPRSSQHDKQRLVYRHQKVCGKEKTSVNMPP